MESSRAAKRPICSPKQAWRNVAILTALFCLLFALPNFILLPRLLPPALDVLSAALWMSLGFTVSSVLLDDLPPTREKRRCAMVCTAA
jgi:hypothetical protein